MRRIADHHFARSATWDEFAAVHARFVHEDIHQPHAAHRTHQANRRSPLAVLSWVRGRPFDPCKLARLFRLLQRRVIRASGCVRFRLWRLYGERGFAGASVASWLAGNALTVEYWAPLPGGLQAAIICMP